MLFYFRKDWGVNTVYEIRTVKFQFLEALKGMMNPEMVVQIGRDQL